MENIIKNFFNLMCTDLPLNLSTKSSSRHQIWSPASALEEEQQLNCKLPAVPHLSIPSFVPYNNNRYPSIVDSRELCSSSSNSSSNLSLRLSSPVSVSSSTDKATSKQGSKSGVKKSNGPSRTFEVKNKFFF